MSPPPAAAPKPAGYDLAGAAKLLGMSQRKLRELVKTKRIACTRIDCRNFLFTQADINEFLATYGGPKTDLKSLKCEIPRRF
jgi:excisionase family DNA binding protein